MTQTVCANLVRLRKKSVEQGDKGEPETRDNMNRMFLSELENVICRTLIDRVADDMLSDVPELDGGHNCRCSRGD